jgi:hypothetical protein
VIVVRDTLVIHSRLSWRQIRGVAAIERQHGLQATAVLEKRAITELTIRQRELLREGRAEAECRICARLSGKVMT